MNVEDSYEGALRRLQRLEAAGLHAMPVDEIARDTDERMRELEELATLACDDNERLKQELATAQVEIQRLRLQVMTLQGSSSHAAASPAQMPAQMPTQLSAPMPVLPGDEDVLDAYRAATTRRGAGFYFFVLTIVGAAVAAALVLRPWEHKVPTAAVVDPTPASAPAVTTPSTTAPSTATPSTTAPATPTTTPAATPTTPAAPATTAATPSTATPATTTPATKPTAATTTPAATTAVPKVAAVIPKVAATIPKVPAAPMVIAPARSRASRHHAKHHAAARKHEGKHGAAAKEPAIGDTDDPLGGTNL